jgi:hypothetical protein
MTEKQEPYLVPMTEGIKILQSLPVENSPLCRNCRFWGERYAWKDDEHGECMKIGYAPTEGLAFLSEPCRLFTKPDFGCIHFEVKDVIRS